MFYALALLAAFQTACGHAPCVGGMSQLVRLIEKVGS